MNSARAWLTPIARNFLFPHRLFFWECPDPDSMTSRSLPQRKRWLFGTGSTRSILAGLSTGAAVLRPFSNEKDSLWEEPASRPSCGKWESKRSILGPPSASGLWNTRSIPVFFAILQPSIRTIFGESTFLYQTSPRLDVPRGHHRLAFPVCCLLGTGSDLGDAVCPGRRGSGLFDLFSGHFQRRPRSEGLETG